MGCSPPPGETLTARFPSDLSSFSLSTNRSSTFQQLPKSLLQKFSNRRHAAETSRVSPHTTRTRQLFSLIEVNRFASLLFSATKTGVVVTWFRLKRRILFVIIGPVIHSSTDVYLVILQEEKGLSTALNSRLFSYRIEKIKNAFHYSSFFSIAFAHHPHRIRVLDNIHFLPLLRILSPQCFLFSTFFFSKTYLERKGTRVARQRFVILLDDALCNNFFHVMRLGTQLRHIHFLHVLVRSIAVVFFLVFGQLRCR